MKRIIDRPQKSDMGSGFGHIADCEGISLKDSLKWLEKNLTSWGTLKIYKDDIVVHYFKFDLYSNYKRFNYENCIGEDEWLYELKVREITFSYCFMLEDVDIYLKE